LLDIGRPPVARRIAGDIDAGIGEPAVMRLLVIVCLAGLDATTWASTSHATHQDPSGLGCESFANGVASLVGLSVSDVLTECYRRLTVANQRGACFDALELDSCPFAAPNYIDACEQRNLDDGLTGCG
jgi:hypothetical protein